MKKYSMPWLAIENQSAEAKHATKVAKVELLLIWSFSMKREKLLPGRKSDILNIGEDALEHWKDL